MTTFTSNRSKFLRLGMAGFVDWSVKNVDRAGIKKAIFSAFEPSSNTTIDRWESDGCFVVTADLATATNAKKTKQVRVLPASGNSFGLVYGQLFKGTSDSACNLHAAQQLLAREDRLKADLYSEIDGGWVGFTLNSELGRLRFYRDEVGILNLFVAEFDGAVCFSTDLRVLTSCLAQAKIDVQATAEFLHYLYHPAPRTMFRDVHAVMPGHVLTRTSNEARQKKVTAGRFNRLDSLPKSSDIDEEVEKQLPRFEEVLLAAVEECVPKHGKFGLALSGGKDSSVLAVILKKLCPERVVAMTVGQRSGAIDESSDAAKVCEHLGLTHRIYSPTDEELDYGLEDFLAAQDQPIGDPAALPFYLGMRAFRSDFSVLLDGTGTDYYFGIASESRGKWKFRNRLRMQNSLPNSLWRLLLRTMSAVGGDVKRLSDTWQEPIEEAFVAWNGWSGNELSEIFGKDVSFSNTYLWDYMKGALNSPSIVVETNAICRMWEPHAPYRKAVSLGNALGMQVRFPLASRRVSDYVDSLPMELRNHCGVNKILIRKYMDKNLPPSIVEKPKSGLIFDLSRVLSSRNRDLQDSIGRIASMLDINERGETIFQTAIDEYLGINGDLGLEQRVYSAWLLAKVLDANYVDGVGAKRSVSAD